MSPVQLSLTAERVVTTIFHSIAVIFSAFRLYRRYKQKSLWWDDYSVFVALILDLVYCSTIALVQEIPSDMLPPPAVRSRKIVAFWITGSLPTVILWLSRISICLSIAKIDMQIAISRIRALFYCLITAFGLFAAAMLAQKIWICSRDTTWYYTPPMRCYIGDSRALMSLIGDLLADTALTALSLNLTWKVRMRPGPRRLLIVISLANILNSLVGIVYGVTDILATELGPHRVLFMLMILHIKTAVSLTVCNLLVVVTYVYSILQRRSVSDTDGRTETPSAPERGPDGRIKDNREPPQTVYILTQFDSNGSPLPMSQQPGATAYSWAGTELGWVPRPRSPAGTDIKGSQGPPSFSCSSGTGSRTQGSARVVSEPCPHQPPNIDSSAIGSPPGEQ